ncbi:ABC transporter permease [Humibacter sp.]|uniref:ABC transporter permease n=1 Tax=Humibacter sp. TaxID=1940291 RepID=UPI002C6C8B43|nr:ABC transporter permease [Humibacter sp.]HVX07925.1 ABC transporter permease [Humibacter sp.]
MRVGALAAFVRRDWYAARSYRLPFALSLATPLFLMAIVFEAGKLIDRAPQRDVRLHHGYFAFVVVGMAVWQATFATLHSFANKLREEQGMGTFEALMATATSPGMIALGAAAYELIQALVASVALILIGALAGADLTGAPAALLVAFVELVVLLAVFAAVGVLVAAFTVVFKRGAVLAAMVAGICALLGGVYFPVSLFPRWAELLANALPFTWGVDALRDALILGDLDLVRLAGLTACAAVTLPLALIVFDRSVDHARRRGTLTQF